MTIHPDIRAMSDAELRSAHNVVWRQVNALLLIGDRDDRRNVLAMLKAEASSRGLL